MFSRDTELFFQFPTEAARRVLHPVEITEISGDLVTAKFSEPGFTPEPDQDFLIYYETRREFVQQSARTMAILETDPSAVFAFRVTGDAVSAESRQCYRASTLLMDIPCELGDEPGCSVLDVSATGLAVGSSGKYGVGESIRVAFSHEGIRAEGTVCVQSIRELPSGHTRYGLHCIGRDEQDRTFRDALSQISLVVQRLQLRRLSGTG